MSELMFDTSETTEYPPDLYRFDRLATYVDSFDDVTQRELDAYAQSGYLAVRRAFAPGEVAGALDGLLDLIDGRVPEFTGIQFEASARERLNLMERADKQDFVRKLMSFAAHEERLRALSEHAALRAVLERLIGTPQLSMFQDMALLKPPGGGREKPWHQDNAFFNVRVGSPIVGVWIALDEATPQNGCMHVIPGSHREGPRVHFKRRDWQICDSEVETGRDVMVPLPPGGCLLFDGLLQHGTPANRTAGDRRRAVQFHYTAADAVWDEEEDRLAVFGSEGKDVTC